MKLFDRFSYKVFSLIVLGLSLILGLASVGVLSYESLLDSLSHILEQYFIASIIVLVVFFVWAIRSVIYGGKSSRETSSGILLENKNGKLLITRESISNLIETVVEENKEISNVSTKLEFDENNNINVYLNFSVGLNASVKDITAEVQTKIKDSVKKTTDLDIKEINIKIKNIEKLGMQE